MRSQKSPVVLFVQPAGTAYGSEKSMLALVGHAKGWTAQVICPPQSALMGELDRMGIQTYPLEFGKHAFSRRPDWHLRLYCRLRRIMNDSRPDVVVINLDGNTPVVTMAAAAIGIPIARFCRFEFKAPHRWLDKWCWRTTSLVVCPSRHVRDQIVEWASPAFAERVHYLYNAHVSETTPPTRRRELQHELGLDQVMVIGYFGRLHRKKNVEAAIEALARITVHEPAIRLLIVGASDGSAQGEMYHSSLRHLAASVGVGERVRFLGYRKDSADLMALCDLVVLPSQSESFGRVLVEAWASGVPTVASDVGGCREITLASGGGLLFPWGDAAALARRISQVLGDAALAGRCREAGKAWVQANCDPARHAEKFLEILRRVLPA